LTRPRGIAKTISGAPQITPFQTASGEAMPSSSHGEVISQTPSARFMKRVARPTSARAMIVNVNTSRPTR
jgi:hypothetical protein